MMDDQTTRAGTETSDDMVSVVGQAGEQENFDASQVTQGESNLQNGADYPEASAAEPVEAEPVEAEATEAEATEAEATEAEPPAEEPARVEQEPTRSPGRGQQQQRSGRGYAESSGADGMMAELLAQSERIFRQFKYGDVIEGTVMRKDHDEVLVDIGAKSEGVIPNNELQSLTAEELSNLSIGDEVLVAVVQAEDKEGHVVLSIDRARQEKSWRKLQRQYENNEIIEAEVTGYNKGGLLVNLEGVRGFVPASQVTGLSTGGNEATKQSELARFTGQKLPLKIIEINRNRNRLILSERQAAQEQRDARKEQLLSELQPGQIRPGTVSSICDFGAFVDIGGADGLIHLSELSWSRVNHPSEVLRVGAPVQVYVMSVDERDRKIALSLKRTQPEPWSTAVERYHHNQLVRGTITQLTDFGAFARLEDGIEGLIHVSELAEGRVTHPRNVVSEGTEVTLRVIRIDPQRRRMGLSLKRAMEPMEGDVLPPQGPLEPPTPRGEGDSGNRGGGGRGAGGGNRGGGRGGADQRGAAAVDEGGAVDAVAEEGSAANAVAEESGAVNAVVEEARPARQTSPFARDVSAVPESETGNVGAAFTRQLAALGEGSDADTDTES